MHLFDAFKSFLSVNWYNKNTKIIHGENYGHRSGIVRSQRHKILRYF